MFSFKVILTGFTKSVILAFDTSSQDFRYLYTLMKLQVLRLQSPICVNLSPWEANC